MSTIWMTHTIIVLMKTADMRIHVGAGLRRRRLSRPISRRFTMVIDRTEKQEDMIPYATKPGYVVLDQLDAAQRFDGRLAGRRLEDEQEDGREPNGEDGTYRVEPERELLVAHLPPDQFEVVDTLKGSGRRRRCRRAHCSALVRLK